MMKAVLDGVGRKVMVMLDPGKALLLGSSDNFAVHDKRSGRVMIERRDAEDTGPAHLVIASSRVI